MYLIGGGPLLTRAGDIPFIEDGAVAVDGALIKKVGPLNKLAAEFPEARFIDAEGGVIMPGFINAHTHFYSSLGRGFRMPGFDPKCFREALAGRSWKLDRSLLFEDCVMSAYASAIGAIRHGVTTVIDHHASSGCVNGSLIGVAGAVGEAGIRACLSFETSERCGMDVCRREIRENEGFIEYCAQYPSGLIRPMFGLHAPFTLSDGTLAECAERCRGRAGFHIHVSESVDDGFASMQLCGKTPVGRLRDSGILGEKTLLAHCVHVSEGELDVIAGTGSMIAVNPMSNMSNAVGCAPVRGMLERGITVGLGTDGFTQSLPESAKALALMMRMTEGRPAVGLGEAARLMVRGNAGIASRLFGADIGVLREGAAADVIILGGRPLTPLDADNADDQLIFGMSASNCRMTMAAGRLLMLDGKLLTLDEEELRRQISETAKALWKRLEAAAPFE
ncbi:MAG: putative aminohydrolase SsnA [Clostridia bacterium]|nr:putative aminohydrolase SsnA [Clostridia bacterium]